MKYICVFILGCCLMPLNQGRAQASPQKNVLGFRLIAEWNGYAQYKHDGELVQQPMNILPNLGAGIVFSVPSGLVSVEGRVVYLPLAQSKTNMAGRGMLSIPINLRYTLGLGAQNTGANLSLALGSEFSNLYLHAHSESGRKEPTGFFISYFGELSLGGMTFNTKRIHMLEFFARVGWGAATQTWSLGLRYSFWKGSF